MLPAAWSGNFCSVFAPMRVGLDVHVLTGAHQGTASVWTNLLPQLPDSHEYVLYSFEPQTLAELYPQRHFLHRKIPPIPAFARIQFAFPLMASRDGCDVFHSNYYGPVLGGPPLVLYVHDLIYLDFPEFSTGVRRALFATLGRASAHAAARVITVSNWARSRILERYGLDESRVQVVPSGLDPSWLRNASDALDPRWGAFSRSLPTRYALAVGRLDPRKNFALTARVVRALVERGLLDGLVIVGPEDFGGTELRRQLARDGTAKIVTHLANLDTRALQAVYRHAQCLFYLSLAEGFGMPLLEAMATEVPIVASNRTSIPEVVADAGIVVDPDRTDDVVEAGAAILSDESLRHRLIVKGRERLRRFDARSMAASVVSVYESVAKPQ